MTAATSAKAPCPMCRRDVEVIEAFGGMRIHGCADCCPRADIAICIPDLDELDTEPIVKANPVLRGLRELRDATPIVSERQRRIHELFDLGGSD